MIGKNIKVTLLGAALLLGLNACGSSSTPSEQTTSDTSPPVITLNGNNPVTVEAGTTYSDALATVTDDVDATNAVLAGTGTVDTSTVDSYTITYNAADAAGNAATAVTRTVNVVDTTAPAKPIITTSFLRTDTTTIGVSGTAEAGTSVKLYDTDGTTELGSATTNASNFWSATITLTEGTHTLTAKAVDAAGNTSVASSILSFLVDTIAPAKPVLTTTSGTVNTPTPIINGTAEAGATVILYDSNGTTALGSATANGSGAWTITASTLADGTHTLSAKAADATGNTSAASAGLSLVIDAAVRFTTAAGSINTTTVTIAGTAQNSASVKLFDTNGTSLLGTANANSSGVWSISITLSVGAHTLTAKTTDGSGVTRVTSPGLSLTVDTTAPAKPVITTGFAFTNKAQIGIHGTAEANATVTLYGTDGTTVLKTATTDSSGSWTTVVSFTDGSYTITAKATDAAGNVSAASSSLSFLVDTIVPNAPAITGPASGTTVTTGSPTISGTAEANASITLSSGTTTLTSIGSGTADSSGNWSLTPSSVLANGSYTLSATAADSAGNVSSASSSISITVNAAAIITGAVIDGKVSGATLSLFSDANMTTQVGTGTTNSVGGFNVTLSVSTAPNPVYILSTGGTDIDTGLVAPNMTFVGETAGSGGLTTFNVTPLTKDIYDRVRNGASVSSAQNAAVTALGLTTGGIADLYKDPTAAGNSAIKSAAFKKLSAATGGGTINPGTYKMFALTMNESAINQSVIGSIADLIKPMSAGGKHFVEANISVANDGAISGSTTGGGGTQFFTGQVVGSSMIFNIVDSLTTPTSITRIVGSIGLNGSVSGNFTGIDFSATPPVMQKGFFVGSLIPATGVNSTGLGNFVSDFYTPGLTTGKLNIVARDIFGATVPRVRWGQAALTAIDVTNGSVTMSDFSVITDAGSVAAASGTPQLLGFSSGVYVKTAAGIPTNIIVLEYKIPPISATSDKLYIATVVGLRRGIYFVVPNAAGTIASAGESYLSKVDSLAPSGFTAGATHDVVTANIDLGMLGQSRANALTNGLSPAIAAPGGMPIGASVNTSNGYIDTGTTGVPELMIFQGSMFVMKSDTNDDFADNKMSGGSVADHLRVVEFFESGAMQGEEIAGGNFPTGSGSPMDGKPMHDYPSTFVGFVHNQTETTPTFTGNMHFLARVIYSQDYSSFVNEFTSGTISITAPTTTAGSATLIASSGSSTAVTSTLSIDVPASGASGVYHIHGALTGSTDYIDISWPIGGTKALYAISNAADGTGTITKLGEVFITQ